MRLKHAEVVLSSGSFKFEGNVGADKRQDSAISVKGWAWRRVLLKWVVGALNNGRQKRRTEVLGGFIRWKLTLSLY